MAVSDTKLADAENPAATKFGDDSDVDFAGRANWLRAAVLGANDGLVSTASLMLGVSAVKHDVRAMVVSGFAGLLAGACSMAIGEYVSVCSQRMWSSRSWTATASAEATRRGRCPAPSRLLWRPRSRSRSAPCCRCWRPGSSSGTGCGWPWWSLWRPWRWRCLGTSGQCSVGRR
ncbi:hypothetical protein ACQ4PT_062942 [Festuca glaucescens]